MPETNEEWFWFLGILALFAFCAWQALRLMTVRP